MSVHDHDGLVTSIYSAAHEARGWVSALEVLREALGLDAYVLMRYSHQRHAPVIPELICVGGSHVSAQADEKYRSYYQAIDPRARLVLDSCDGAVFSCDEHFDSAYVSRSEFYQDFLIPEKLRFCMATGIRMPHDTDYALGLQRSADRGPYDARTLQCFQRLIPHLSRSLRIYEQIGRQQAYASATNTALSTLPWAIFCLDRDGLYLGGNDLAESILSDGLLVKAERQGLRFADADSQQRYGRALRRCLGHKQSESVLVKSSRTDIGRMTATILPADQEPKAASLLSQSIPRSASIRAVCVFAPLDNGEIRSASQLMGLFDLTPAEARLARAMAAGASLVSYSSETGVAMSTLRSQLHAIFQKTDCDRQADLVRLFGNIPSLPETVQTDPGTA